MDLVLASSHRKVDTFLNPIIELLPKLILFIVILVVGFIVARLVKAAITKALQAAGIDRALHSGQSGQYVEKISPAALVASVAYYLIILAVLGIAISTIGGTAADNSIGSIVAYLPNVVVAILIFVALMVPLALGLALAFGRGGRDPAAQALQSAQASGKEQRDQVKQDFQKGRDQAQQDAQHAREKAQERMGSGGQETGQQPPSVQTRRPPAPER